MAWPPPACPGAGAALCEAVQEAQHLQPLNVALDFAELFAGKGAVHRAIGALGYQCRAMDKSYALSHDLLTPVGLLAAIRICLAIRPQGTVWFAPPCSSWVWLTRHSSGRGFVVEGDATLNAIVQQNAVAHRVAFLCHLLSARGCFWIIEQPQRSVLWEYPAMEALLQEHSLTGHPVHLEMGAFGGTSVKGTHLYGTAPYLGQLELRCSQALRMRLQHDYGVQTTKKTTDAEGRRRTQGTKDLKGTQAYPEGFGASHAQAFSAFYGPPKAEAPPGSPRAPSHPKAQEDAYLCGSVLLRLQAHSPWWLRDFLGEPWV